MFLRPQLDASHVAQKTDAWGSQHISLNVAVSFERKALNAQLREHGMLKTSKYCTRRNTTDSRIDRCSWAQTQRRRKHEL